MTDFIFQKKRCQKQEKFLLNGTKKQLMKRFWKELNGICKKRGSNTRKSKLQMRRKDGVHVLIAEI
jgi:hypothetical protein